MTFSFKPGKDLALDDVRHRVTVDMAAYFKDLYAQTKDAKYDTMARDLEASNVLRILSGNEKQYQVVTAIADHPGPNGTVIKMKQDFLDEFARGISRRAGGSTARTFRP